MVPVEIIVYIASYIGGYELKLMNREIYEEIMKEERSKEWKQKYNKSLEVITKLPAIVDSMNWKYEYCRINRLNYFDNFSINFVAHNYTCANSGGNKINEIPKELCNLENLEGLYLYNNMIRVIPKEIGKLVQLRWLNLEYNSIEDIPKEIGKLVNLSGLFLKMNQIIKIDDGLINDLDNMVKLVIINLELNKIRKKDLITYPTSLLKKIVI